MTHIQITNSNDIRFGQFLLLRRLATTNFGESFLASCIWMKYWKVEQVRNIYDVEGKMEKLMVWLIFVKTFHK